MDTVYCCGYSVPSWLFDFLEANDFSVRAASIICRLYTRLGCKSFDELKFYLGEYINGRLPFSNCGKRTIAEIVEKLA